MKPTTLFTALGLAVALLTPCAQSREPLLFTDALRPFVERNELAGAVALVVNREKILSTEAVGFANIADKTPMSSDSLFWIASQTKPITAVAVMMLVDDGKIALDDPVEKYLPEFRGQMVVAEKSDERVVLQKPVHPVTIRETLNHMSGMPFQSAAEIPVLDGLPLDRAVRSYAMTPLQTEPGTAYQYSNAGINTAARIIEVVSGQSYEDFLQESLLNPLGMSKTTFWPDLEQSKTIALSYRPNAEKTGLEPFPIKQLTYPLADRTRRFAMPAGGLFSTAADTARFCRMLLNGGELDGRRYLSDASFSEMTKRQTPESLKNSYGLGFAVSPDSFGHGGAHATNMEIHFEKGVALVWMVQHSGFPGKGAEAQGVFKKLALEKFAK
jgi:CubicO group peptidase (beta-lactamase class C family)